MSTTNTIDPETFDAHTRLTAQLTGLDPHVIAAQHVAHVEKQVAKAHKKYKRARRRLLELVIWQSPKLSMGVSLTDHERLSVVKYLTELVCRIRAARRAHDDWTNWAVQINSDISNP